jgi:hypothetical protein
MAVANKQWALLIGITALCGGMIDRVSADIIYSNLAPANARILPNAGLASPNPTPFRTYGDHVQFGPGHRTIDRIDVELMSWSWDFEPIVGDITVLVYEDNNGSVGDLIATETSLAHSFQYLIPTVVSFSNIRAPVGNSAFFGFAVKTEVIPPEFYNEYQTKPLTVAAWSNPSPNPGYSDPTSLLQEVGYGLSFGSVPYNTSPEYPQQNLRFEVSAIPEPNLGIAFGIGIIAVVMCVRAAQRYSKAGVSKSFARVLSPSAKDCHSPRNPDPEGWLLRAGGEADAIDELVVGIEDDLHALLQA